MRNYLFSIAVHLILLLLLLGWTSLTPPAKPIEARQVIMVDFSNEMNKNDEAPSKKKTPVVQPNSLKPNISSLSNLVKEEKAKHVKTIEKKTLLTSQKPKAESSRSLQEEAPIVKKVIPPQEKSPIPQERAEAKRTEAERQKRKSEKVSAFKSLLSKATKKPATEEDQQEKNDKLSSEEGISETSASANKNIQGVLGNRKVLKVPTIKDNSQKKGKVVVRICVDASGKVSSAKYTMMGSTTNDTYLIKLAEKGAKEYLFSPSEHQKECGNVIIDFQLK